MAKGNGSWLLRSYSFVDGVDPEVYRCRTAWQKEHIKESELAVLAGLHTSTVRNMFGSGKKQTIKPQHATFGKLYNAMGYHWGLKRTKTPNYEREIPIAREEYKAHKEALRKKREREAARGK